MEQKKPTQEQVKEFWEWCGFTTKKTRVHDFGDKYTMATHWHSPDNKKVWFGCIPEANLDNLFKYAVPKVKVITLTNVFKDWTATVNQGEMIKGKVKAIGESQDPALALFWAIWEVIKK